MFIFKMKGMPNMYMCNLKIDEMIYLHILNIKRSHRINIPTSKKETIELGWLNICYIVHHKEVF